MQEDKFFSEGVPLVDWLSKIQMIILIKKYDSRVFILKAANAPYADVLLTYISSAYVLGAVE